MMPQQNHSPELQIEAGKAEAHYWRDLFRYRELLWFLAWRDIKVRYKQMSLGILWALIQPVVQTLLLSLVFSRLAGLSAGRLAGTANPLPYTLLVFVGLLPWQLFSSAFSGAGNSMVGNSHLITKVYFPRLIMPLSAMAVALVDLCITLAIGVGYAAWYGLFPGWRLLVLPLFVLMALLVALGAGLWIGSLSVKYRDFRFITPFILQIGYFVTPVGFRTDGFGQWGDLLALNPLTFPVEGFRWCILGGDSVVHAYGAASTVFFSIILVLSGLWYFRRTERAFADII